MNGHIPVLLEECIKYLNIKPDGVYVDGTLGMGGHSEAILQRLTTGRLISIDRDELAIERAGERLKAYSERLTIVHGNFRDLDEILDEQGVTAVDGMLFDLGVSSPQLDEGSRGFSYMLEAPLDMRMDKADNIDAWFIVNRWPEEKIMRILRDYGEERHAARIAKAIAARREEKEIQTTTELVEVIKAAMPAAALREKQHPAKRSFQAIRIAVNDELGAVAAMMDSAPDRLKQGGRLCVISFHSLEDRIVKNAIHARENGCTCPREAPVCTCGFVQTLRSVTRKPITAGGEELELNPRSRSAKLRVAEKQIVSNPKPEEYSAARKPETERRHYGRGWCINVLAVLGVAAAVMLCVASLLAKAELTRLTAERAERQENLQALMDEQSRLEAEYESLYSPGVLDDYARCTLGMRPIQQDQIVIIEAPRSDYAVVYADEAESKSLSERLAGAVSSVSEYFAQAGE